MVGGGGVRLTAASRLISVGGGGGVRNSAMPARRRVATSMCVALHHVRTTIIQDNIIEMVGVFA
jgi:hypothetical protein